MCVGVYVPRGGRLGGKRLMDSLARSLEALGRQERGRATDSRPEPG
jgi:hypothetical protein